VRQEVARAYARAVTREGTAGCCGGVASKGAVVSCAGYRPEEVEGLPTEAAQASFGCGNPLAFAEVEQGQVVVDLGCGAGLDLLLAARKVGPRGRVIGIDMTEEMLRQARRNIEAAGLGNAEVRQGLIEALPLEDSSVDWVISNCVINLSPEKDRVFAEIARVLRPGGRFLISDIVVEDLPDIVRQNRQLYTGCLAGAISEKAYLEGLRAAGLRDLEVRHRLVYSREKLISLLESEIPEAGSTDWKALVPLLEGQVCSLQFYGRKA
jgi:SAM-dependent methyltransferase